MIDVLTKPIARTDHPPMEAAPDHHDDDEDMAEVWAALERSVGYERPSRPSDAVAS